MKPLTVVAILLLLSGSAQAADQPGAATSMPADGVMPEMPPMLVTGSIAVKAVQGTKGGPKIALDEVTVELYGQGGKLQTIEAKLDEHGVVMIENLPLLAPFRPRVIVKHGGTSYTKDGEVMDAENPALDITVTVFETSDKNPQWKVDTWSVTVQPAAKGEIKVTQSLVLTNSADSAYLGAADAAGRRTSIAMALPKGAKILEMSGALHDCCAKVVGDRLLSKAPLEPGVSQLELTYSVPMSGRTAEIDLVAPAQARKLTVFIPKGSEGFQSDTLKAGEVLIMSNRPMQSYTVSDVSAGRKISFTVGAMPDKSTTGSIAIKAVQGTKDGPKIEGGKVVVELYGKGGKLRTIDAKLDANGVAMIEDLPLGAPFQPKATVLHAGASYEKIGEMITPEHPTQNIEITVFETSDKDPQLEVAMWHLILHPVEKGGLMVNETLAVRNMNDSAYLGKPDAEGRRIAIAIPLPKGVKKVDKVSGGLDECCTSVVNGRLLSKSPIKPGISQLRFQYTVPASGGSVAVDLVAPMVARQLMIFIPKDTEGFSSDHLKAGEVFDVHGKAMQAYTISDISAGQKISFTLAGPIPKASSLPKILAALGGVILVILCVVVLLIRRPEGELESNAA